MILLAFPRSFLQKDAELHKFKYARKGDKNSRRKEEEKEEEEEEKEEEMVDELEDITGKFCIAAI